MYWYTYSCLQSIKMAITNRSVIANMAETTKIMRVPSWLDSSKITSGRLVDGLAKASETKNTKFLLKFNGVQTYYKS